MKFHIFTIFPKMFQTPFNEGVVGRASRNDLIEIVIHDIRTYSKDPHKRVDDYPYGGGPGMLMRPEPLFDAIETAKNRSMMSPQTPIILMTPQGRRLNHKIAVSYTHLTLPTKA